MTDSCWGLTKQNSVKQLSFNKKNNKKIKKKRKSVLATTLVYSHYELHILIIHNNAATAAAAKSLQSCQTLCDPIDGSPPGSPVPGILQARILEWVAISFFNAWKWKVKAKSLSRVWLLATSRTAAYQAPPSTGFSRQEYRSTVGCHCFLRNNATYK